MRRIAASFTGGRREAEIASAAVRHRSKHGDVPDVRRTPLMHLVHRDDLVLRFLIANELATVGSRLRLCEWLWCAEQTH